MSFILISFLFFFFLCRFAGKCIHVALTVVVVVFVVRRTAYYTHAYFHFIQRKRNLKNLSVQLMISYQFVNNNLDYKHVSISTVSH